MEIRQDRYFIDVDSAGQGLVEYVSRLGNADSVLNYSKKFKSVSQAEDYVQSMVRLFYNPDSTFLDWHPEVSMSLSAAIQLEKEKSEKV